MMIRWWVTIFLPCNEYKCTIIKEGYDLISTLDDMIKGQKDERFNMIHVHVGKWVLYISFPPELSADELDDDDQDANEKIT